MRATQLPPDLRIPLSEEGRQMNARIHYNIADKNYILEFAQNWRLAQFHYRELYERAEELYHEIALTPGFMCRAAVDYTNFNRFCLRLLRSRE